MATIQSQIYKNNGKTYRRYFISLEKKIIKQLALKGGDELFFNGEIGDEMRFKLVRKINE